MRESVTLYAVKGGYWLQHLHVDPPTAPTSDERTDDILLYLAPDTGGISVMPGTFDGPLALTIETGEDVREQDPADWEFVNDLELVALGAGLVVATLDDLRGPWTDRAEAGRSIPRPTVRPRRPGRAERALPRAGRRTDRAPPSAGLEGVVGPQG